MKIKLEEITIGSDPEFSLQNKYTLAPISAVGIIPGTKAKPLPMDLEGFALQLDNVNCEYNIPPTKTKEEFDSYLQYGIDYIKKIFLSDEIIPCFNAATDFPESMLNNDIARTFGCTPSVNAWTESMNIPPDSNGTLRSIGFHIHYGYKTNLENINLKLEIMKAFDLLLTVPSIIIDPDTERRKLYGKAGEMRFTNYGLEARTLSGYFNSTSELRQWVFTQSLNVIDYINNNPEIEPDSELGLQIQECINNMDENLAYYLIEKFNINLPKIKKNVITIS